MHEMNEKKVEKIEEIVLKASIKIKEENSSKLQIKLKTSKN